MLADYEEVMEAALAEPELWEALAALGFDYAECRWHVDHPGQRIVQAICD